MTHLFGEYIYQIRLFWAILLFYCLKLNVPSNVLFSVDHHILDGNGGVRDV